MSTSHSILSSSKERFLNRELSWLAFNLRVLEEAFEQGTPLLERLNFLAISAANLDEFYMVRVAGLKDYVARKISVLSIDGLTPEQELQIVHGETMKIIERQNKCWDEIQNALKKEGVSIVRPDDLSTADIEWLSTHFLTNIFPVLTPIAIDPAHPFPLLPNLGMALVFELAAGVGKNSQVAIVPLPGALSRFTLLPGKRMRFLALEDIISFFVDALFPGMLVKHQATFRIVRDSDLDIEEEAEDFVRQFERAVKERRRGRVIRARFLAPAPQHLVHFVTEQMHLLPDETLELPGMLGMRAIREIFEACEQKAKLKFPPFDPRSPERIDDYSGDCFAAIAAKDIVIHHPFETFDVVLRFLQQAANDPQVVSIKQTLYRTSKNSPIVQALIEAADAGKSVTALVELKARFDEEANLKWARDLERAGVQVVFGFVSLKTHAKVTLVTRKEGGNPVSYAHFGTGNYHPATAKSYTDLSFFTCEPDLCRDAAYLFNFVTGYAPPRSFRKLIVAPRNMRKRLLAMIDAEIEHAKAGKPAAIWAKMNALVDPEVIDALYQASSAGVIVELVVRGICCLRPGVPGLSEHIRVKSIVGRFLEHARIYCFANGHELPSPNAKVYIGSADWMPRNLDWRVELMVPVENPTVHAQVLDQIMVANMKDEKNSWIMQPDGTYKLLYAGPESFSAADYFLDNPSLSGRGTGLKKMKSPQMLQYKTTPKKVS